MFPSDFRLHIKTPAGVLCQITKPLTYFEPRYGNGRKRGRVHLCVLHVANSKWTYDDE